MVSGPKAGHRPSGGGDTGALAVEMIDRADIVEMLVAQDFMSILSGVTPTWPRRKGWKAV
jgi:hypothetical protein